MSSIHYLTGDATAPAAQGDKFICHVCNDVGGWGKGFVMAISHRWPEPEKQYRRWYQQRDSNDFALGAVQLVQVENDLWVANMIGQHGLRPKDDVPPIRYDAVAQCLEKVSVSALKQDATLHMPRIGCGLAGGNWEDIEPILESNAVAKGIDVYVYDRG